MSSPTKEPLLSEIALSEIALSDWSQQDAVQEMKASDPERWEKSRQFVIGMKELERLIRLKLEAKDAAVDLECLVCIYNLFLSISQ